MEINSRHQCLIYEGPPSQKLPIIAAILKRKLEEGYRCLYLNSAPMVAGMGSTLASLGVDVVSEIANQRIILSSEPVSVDSVFNSTRMLEKLETEIDLALRDGYKGLWASGDMTWEFAPLHDFSKLVEYEMGLEELFTKRHELCGICQYHKDTLPQDAMRQSLLMHSSVVINETLTRMNPHFIKASAPGDEIPTPKLDKLIDNLSKM